MIMARSAAGSLRAYPACGIKKNVLGRQVYPDLFFQDLPPVMPNGYDRPPMVVRRGTP